MKNKNDVFISYSHKDRIFVEKLKNRLVESGITVFYDQSDIAVGTVLSDSIYQAIQSAKYLLVVMSPDFFESVWATTEFELGLSQEFQNDKTKVIPLLYRDCDIPPLLRTTLYADFRTDESFEQSFPKLLMALFEKPISSFRQPKKEKGISPTPGSIGSISADSEDLKIMIEDLQTKVNTFIDGSKKKKIGKEETQINIDPRLCFIVMPFGPEELSDVYEYFVKPSIELNCDLKCERGDDVFGSNVIMDDIQRSIEKARIVVPDLTGRNPNVFYEVGIAHALNKDVLLLSNNERCAI